MPLIKEELEHNAGYTSAMENVLTMLEQPPYNMQFVQGEPPVPILFYPTGNVIVDEESENQDEYLEVTAIAYIGGSALEVAEDIKTTFTPVVIEAAPVTAAKRH